MAITHYLATLKVALTVDGCRTGVGSPDAKSLFRLNEDGVAVDESSTRITLPDILMALMVTADWYIEANSKEPTAGQSPPESA